MNLEPQKAVQIEYVTNIILCEKDKYMVIKYILEFNNWIGSRIINKRVKFWS